MNCEQGTEVRLEVYCCFQDEVKMVQGVWVRFSSASRSMRECLVMMTKLLANTQGFEFFGPKHCMEILVNPAQQLPLQ